ncbi:heparan-alpha-glucosaminide N-acetyltransferase [Thermodesulfobacteriota bacterium]
MIDFLRGLGVLLMIIFHLVFDLNFFRLIIITFLNNPYWLGFGRFILSIFLVCVGIGLRIVHKKGIKWNLVKKRFYKIGGWALIITTVTFILLPKHFVFFGVLHCIALSSVIGVFFVNKPKLSLLLCLMLMIPYLIFQPTLIPVSRWLGVISADYTPLFPWISMVFLGIYLESVDFHNIPLKENLLIKPFKIMGRHSLKIYLLHQPILLGALLLVKFFWLQT